MSLASPIRDLILQNAEAHPADLISYVARQRQVSRQAVHQELKKLIAEGVLIAHGKGRKLTYALVPLVDITRQVSIASGTEEDVVWRDTCNQIRHGLPKNVLEICSYGFCEIFNNAIDHSGASVATVSICQTAASVRFKITDSGIGIFKKICSQFHLADEHDAILELAKGKLTTDPVRHSGQGIFFASRIFNYFSITSGSVVFRHVEPEDDWIIEDRSTTVLGTEVDMRISLTSTLTLKEVFDKYVQDHEAYTFDTTDIPVALMMRGEEAIISRSQARRLLARLEAFRDVTLDFKGVEIIGQAFADEVFRVYATANSQVRIRAVNAVPDVERMIRRANPAADVYRPKNGHEGASSA